MSENMAKPDWTTCDGRSNSSELFEQLVEQVARLMRSEAHALLCGGSESVARLVMAQLAHVHGLGPIARLQEERDELLEALQAADSIMWMAEQYADGGGSGGPEMRDYLAAKTEIDKALKKPEAA